MIGRLRRSFPLRSVPVPPRSVPALVELAYCVKSTGNGGLLRHGECVRTDRIACALGATNGWSGGSWTARCGSLCKKRG